MESATACVSISFLSYVTHRAVARCAFSTDMYFPVALSMLAQTDDELSPDLQAVLQRLWHASIALDVARWSELHRMESGATAEGADVVQSLSENSWLLLCAASHQGGSGCAC